MPPKCKFTKEQIVSAAVDLVREKGIQGLTARSLAAAMGSSARPIFGLFQSMEEVQGEVLRAAYGLYQSYLRQGLEDKAIPPYKASGIAYIRFAKEERELFKLLFMRDRTGETVGEDRDEVRPLLDLIMRNLGITEDEAFLFHLESWVYVHGIATMIATSYLNWDMEFISKTLTDVYEGLKYRYTGGK